MGYKRADSILPKEIVELIQQYVDGENIYIPKKDGHRRNWGENTDTKQMLDKRNTLIYRDFKTGMKTNELAEKYFLSIKSIQRIINDYKKDEL